ncbi:MAG: HD domain-containing protein, partial [Lachnospiraceae bacterium]|nr:HD domain-containing protein [Lachnospiraceae bacterium]
MLDENVKNMRLEMPKEGEDPDKVFLILLEAIKSSFSKEEVEKFEKAYDVAKKLHSGQKRRSGEDYIVHPLCVAIILYNLHMDLETIIAGVLHDTVEDTKYTLDDCKRDFGESIARIVDGVTKLGKLSYTSDTVE